MIPATTIWLAGVKHENSIFHRQKFVYRTQRGCQIIPLPCDPCSILGSLFPSNCNDETFICDINPSTDFPTLLSQTVGSFISANNLACNQNTLTTSWYLEMRIENQIILREKFYSGIATDTPTIGLWKNTVINNLSKLLNYGLDYLVDGDTIYISNSGCDEKFKNKYFKINVGLEFEISCN
jgi:hypothetical protein